MISFVSSTWQSMAVSVVCGLRKPERCLACRWDRGWGFGLTLAINQQALSGQRHEHMAMHSMIWLGDVSKVCCDIFIHIFEGLAQHSGLLACALTICQPTQLSSRSLGPVQS